LDEHAEHRSHYHYGSWPLRLWPDQHLWKLGGPERLVRSA